MRKVTTAERRHYRDHGVVYLPEFLDEDWLKRLEAACYIETSTDSAGLNIVDFRALTPMFEAAGAKLVTPEAKSAPGRFRIGSFNWRAFPEVAAIACGPPLPERMAALMDSDRLNFYGEQLFFKEADSLHRTVFHQDLPYFHVTGQQCCTVWMPLDPAVEDSGMMGYVRGSHRWPTHASSGFVTQHSMIESPLPQLPDIEGAEGDYDIVYYPAQPGDIIVHHANTVHGSTGNASNRHRRAFSLHYLGDDVRYCKRQGVAQEAGMSPALNDGDRMDCEAFPLVWTRTQGYLM